MRSLGIKHKRITVGNSQANGQVERTVRTVKDAIRRMLTSRPSTYWSDHVPAALMMLRFTPQRTLGLAPFVVATGHVAVPPSHLIEMGVDFGSDDVADVEGHLE